MRGEARGRSLPRVFISYNRRLDKPVAKALERALPRIAWPPYRWPRLAVFRDGSDIPAGGSLTSAVEDALERSDYFLLVASPESRDSAWVERESTYWLAHGGSLDRLFVLLVEGEIPDVLPPTLRTQWDGDISYVDFTPRRESGLDLTDDAFLRVVAAIAAPVLGREKRRLIEEHRRERARAARARRLARAGLVILTVLALVLAGFATVQRNAAVRQSRVALSQRVAAEAQLLAGSDRNLAAQLSLVAWRTAQTDQARNMLVSLAALGVPTRVFTDVPYLSDLAVSPDGRLLLTASPQGIIRFWEVADPRRPRPVAVLDPKMGAVTAVRLTDGGRTLLLGGSRGVSVWDISDPRRPRAGGRGPLAGLARDLLVASNGVLAVTTEQGTVGTGGSRVAVHLWQRRGARITPVTTLAPTGGKGSVALSEDGRLLAFARPDGAVQLWNIEDLRRPTDAGLLPANVTGGARVVAFNHDHSLLAVAPTAGRPVVFWKLEAGRAAGPPTASFAVTSPVVAMRYAPDDRTLALTLDQGAVVALDVRSLAYRVLVNDPSGISAAAFRPDGRTLLVALSTGTLQLVPVATRPVPEPLGPVTAIAAFPGNVIVTLRSASVQSWRVTPGVPPEPGAVVSGQGVAIAADPATSRLAVARAGDIALFRLDRLGRASPLGTVPLAGATALALTSDQILIAGGAGRTLFFWDVRAAGHPRPLGRLTPPDGAATVPSPADRVTSVVANGGSRCGAFITTTRTIWVFGGGGDWRQPVVTTIRTVSRTSPGPLALSADGRTLATTTGGPSFRLATLGPDCRIVRDAAYPGRGHAVTAVAFGAGADADTLATADTDQVTRLWDVADGPPAQSATLLSASGAPWTVTLTAGGGAAVGSGDGGIVSWDVDADAVFRRVCAVVGAPLTAAEWQEHVGGRRPRDIC